MDANSKKIHILQTLATLPAGYVTTYSALAKKTGTHHRAVASVLRANTLTEQYCCYRVVYADGTVSGYRLGIDEKIRRLEADGISVRDGKIPTERILTQW